MGHVGLVKRCLDLLTEILVVDMDHRTLPQEVRVLWVDWVA